MFLNKMRERLAKEEGFTLIELLVVLVIIAVLLAIAVPSYLGFKDRAEKRAAASNVRSAIPAAEAYYSDHSGYAGMTAAYLKASYDASIDPAKTVVASPDADSYCLQSAVNTKTYHFNGPDGSAGGVTTGVC